MTEQTLQLESSPDATFDDVKDLDELSELDDLDGIEFALEEIENKIAPLALA